MTDIRKAKGTVRTVLGDINADSLGYCQCHEHLFIRRGRPCEVNPALYMEDADKVVSELALYRNAGGRALVDAQPGGCGRMAGALQDASARSGVHIVASTGFHKLVYYPENHWIFQRGEDELADRFIREIEEGMADESFGEESVLSSRCRAGVIKTALDTCGITGRYETLFGAAASTARSTGAAVLLHVEAGADATDSLSFFAKRHVPAGALIFCHMDRAESDTGRHREIAQAGAHLEYDTIARFKYHSDASEIELIKGMLASGYEDKLLLGLDTTRVRLKSYGAAIGLDYIQTSFIPEMKARGIGEAQIEKFTVQNPASALAIRPKP